MKPIPGANEPAAEEDRIAARIEADKLRRRQTAAVRRAFAERRIHGLRARHQARAQFGTSPLRKGSTVQRFTKLIETTHYRGPQGEHIVLPDVDTYAHPGFAEAFRQLTRAAQAVEDAHERLGRLNAEARRRGSHDAEELAAAEKAAEESRSDQAAAWQELQATLRLSAGEIRDHHRAQREAAAARVCELVAQLRQASSAYICHSAMLQVADGNLTPHLAARRDIPGLYALDCAFHGDGLDSPAGLDAAIEAIATGGIDG